METTGLGMAMVAAGGLFGGLLIERVLIGVRWGPYFRMAFPLGRHLIPIQSRPEGGGETASVRWEVDARAPLVARYWAEPGSRAAPMGLHGQVVLVPMQGGRFALEVSWAPPWSVLFAAFWLVFLGLLRGEGWVTVPVGSAMVVGIAVLYWRSALTAARELRWAFIKGED